MQEQVVKEKDAARFLDVTVAYMRKRRVVGGGPPFVRLGGRRSVRYRMSDLLRWLDENVVSSTSGQVRR